MVDHIQINALKPRVQYVGDGTRSHFLYSFPVFLESNLEVYLDSVRQVSGYTVSGVGDSEGGSVTFEAPPATGVLVTLRRQLVIERLSDFQDSGQFRAKVLNDELDQLTACIQQLETEAARSIRLNPTDSDSSLLLPEAAKRAGHTIVFDARGDLTTRSIDAATSAAWRSMDDVPEGTANKHFTEAERCKLAAIGIGAEANPLPTTDDEKSQATETRLRSFSPKDIRDITVQHTPRGAVASVHGRTGVITAQPGDYTADQIVDSIVRVLMTADERAKLAAIEANARAYPPLVNAAEKLDGTLGETRSFSPKDISEMIAVLGGRSSGNDNVDGGNARAHFSNNIDGGLASA